MNVITTAKIILFILTVQRSPFFTVGKYAYYMFCPSIQYNESIDEWQHIDAKSAVEPTTKKLSIVFPSKIEMAGRLLNIIVMDAPITVLWSALKIINN